MGSLANLIQNKSFRGDSAGLQAPAPPGFLGGAQRLQQAYRRCLLGAVRAARGCAPVWLTQHAAGGALGEVFQKLNTDGTSHANQHWAIRVGRVLLEHELDADDDLRVDLGVDTTFDDRATVGAGMCPWTVQQCDLTAARGAVERWQAVALANSGHATARGGPDNLAKALCPGRRVGRRSKDINLPPTAHGARRTTRPCGAWSLSA
ncbi:hypothetical protein CALCODRAFT_505634 [Calocera cornea HHB12733]|uniref:Uncharacterized protein n=1 Tax=Calocera cornea HHB12733 TaxID=1353952 RepID=A0A165JUR6_9BASI|nr:hypothetical protein CALCODRAFT_505634 [Calocera cornea HHB12733]